MSETVTSTWRIPEFITKVKEHIQARLELVGVFVQSEATSRCVVGTYPKGSGRIGGRLRGSITYATDTSHSEVRAEGSPSASSGDGIVSAPTDVVRIGTNVEYAPYVELGLSGNAPNANFLRGAVEENRDQITKLFNFSDNLDIKEG